MSGAPGGLAGTAEAGCLATEVKRSEASHEVDERAVRRVVHHAYRMERQAFVTVTGAPRSTPRPSAALLSAFAISSTSNELINARYSPGFTLP